MSLSLGPGGEFDLIRRMVGDAPLPRGVRVGPGDDAAVLDGGWVLSTDLSVEDVHFRRGWLTPREMGYRAAAAALSDLAAMAAEPVGLLLSMGLPVAEAGVLGPEVQAGAHEAARSVGAGILGGDLARSPGPLFLDVVVLGRTPSPVLRSRGVPGDELWVTGRLGGAARAVALMEEGFRPPRLLREAWVRPVPRIREALWLAERGVLRAAIDLSDGLAGDAAHLAAGGGLRIVLSGEDLPLHPSLESGDLSPAEARRLALEGGEDYELAFLSPPGATAPLVSSFLAAFGVPLTRVGWAEAGEGVVLAASGGVGEQALGRGFNHFGDGA